jgi:hypothetical protein
MGVGARGTHPTVCLGETTRPVRLCKGRTVLTGKLPAMFLEALETLVTSDVSYIYIAAFN